jgi:hypothetical protein
VGAGAPITRLLVFENDEVSFAYASSTYDIVWERLIYFCVRDYFYRINYISGKKLINFVNFVNLPICIFFPKIWVAGILPKIGVTLLLQIFE